ncbi:MAG: hypothetical protein LBH22_07965 [Bacteroidales bacterium]|jgi:hypothetical protein|nr:hypothetical protein [Bacteroidales bacterium]
MKKKTTRPRIEDQRQYKKIGRLRKNIADQIRKPAANIYVDDNHLKHIFEKHTNELAKVGLTPEMFVDLVVNNFNRIYKSNNRESILLVQWNGTPKVAVIELNLAFKDRFYEIKTAFVKTKVSFKNLKLLWKKK